MSWSKDNFRHGSRAASSETRLVFGKTPYLQGMTAPPRRTIQAAVHIRPYTPADLNACLALFASNCPPFFHPSERADYEAFLQDPADRGEYFVLEGGTDLVACGGIWADTQGVGGLSWGMVRGNSEGGGLHGQGLQGQGLGTRLTAYRLDLLRQRPEVRRVRLDTSQHTEAFYARQGFVVVDRTPDGFAPGLDEVKMLLDLT